MSIVVEAFPLFANKARNLLKSSLELKNYHIDFSLGVFPSFDLTYIWVFYTPCEQNKSSGPIAQKLAWRTDFDLAKFSNPIERMKYGPQIEPTIESCKFDITTEWLINKKSELKDITIPMYISTEFMLGLDGTTYEFECLQGFHKLSLRWWHDGPKVWMPLTEWASALLEEMNSKLDQN
jgi:hypothetical protein